MKKGEKTAKKTPLYSAYKLHYILTKYNLSVQVNVKYTQNVYSAVQYKSCGNVH